MESLYCHPQYLGDDRMFWIQYLNRAICITVSCETLALYRKNIIRNCDAVFMLNGNWLGSPFVFFFRLSGNLLFQR